jgi:hypothetical protein
MERHEAVNKVLRDMKASDLINPDYAGEARIYLNALWVAGWENGYEQINQHGNKIIGQYNREGKLINTFKSQIEAAKKTGFTAKGIYNCMKRETPMKQGWTWRYI